MLFRCELEAKKKINIEINFRTYIKSQLNWGLCGLITLVWRHLWTIPTCQIVMQLILIRSLVEQSQDLQILPLSFSIISLYQWFSTFLNLRHPSLVREQFGCTLDYNLLLKDTWNLDNGGTPRAFTWWHPGWEPLIYTLK